MELGFSGRLTRATIRSPLTSLILLATLAFGLIALMLIPREEEPQISVPMVDIMVQADGLKGADAAELVTKPLEQIVKGINGVEWRGLPPVSNNIVTASRPFQRVTHDRSLPRPAKASRGIPARWPHCRASGGCQGGYRG